MEVDVAIRTPQCTQISFHSHNITVILRNCVVQRKVLRLFDEMSRSIRRNAIYRSVHRSEISSLSVLTVFRNSWCGDVVKDSSTG